MFVTIHQPEFLPWLGFFEKIRQADLFVALDTVQFRRNYFQNRNRIRTREGYCWITAPTLHPVLVPIREVRLDTRARLWKKNVTTVRQTYARAPFCATAVSLIEDELTSPPERLVDLNLSLIARLMRALRITTPVIRASELLGEPALSGSDLLLALCREAGATRYLSGISGRDYLDVDRFRHWGIDVTFQEFHHPVYTQLHEPFMPCMTVLDLLFNHGPKSREILDGTGVPRLEATFR